MKILLKFWLIVTLSLITILTLVSSCDDTTTAQRDTGKTTTDRGRTGSSNDRDPVLSCATLDKCNNCCENKNSCDSYEECTDDNYDNGELGLSSSDCKKLDEDTISDLVDIFKIIYNPEEDSKKRKEINLYTQIDLDNNDDTEKLNLACSAVQSFPDLLNERRVKDEVYNRETKAKFILGWIASKQEASELFLNIPDDEEKIKVFRALLQEASNGSGDQGVLNGLKEKVTAETGLDKSEENKLLLQLAKDENNDFLIRKIHEYIITEGDDDAPPLCHNDSSNTNLPEPDTTATPGTDNNHYAAGSAQDNARKNKYFACILGVYCSMSDTISDVKDKKDFLRSMVDEVGRTNIENFITDTAADGGLAVASRPAERWEPVVCTELKDFWNNGTGLDLGLGGVD